MQYFQSSSERFHAFLEGHHLQWHDCTWHPADVKLMISHIELILRGHKIQDYRAVHLDPSFEHQQKEMIALQATHLWPAPRGSGMIWEHSGGMDTTYTTFRSMTGDPAADEPPLTLSTLGGYW